MSEETEQVLQTAVKLIVHAANETIYADPHQWSTRPCQTCRTITALIGEPFGCYLYQTRQRDSQPSVKEK